MHSKLTHFFLQSLSSLSEQRSIIGDWRVTGDCWLTVALCLGCLAAQENSSSELWARFLNLDALLDGVLLMIFSFGFSKTFCMVGPAKDWPTSWFCCCSEMSNTPCKLCLACLDACLSFLGVSLLLRLELRFDRDCVGAARLKTASSVCCSSCSESSPLFARSWLASFKAVFTTRVSGIEWFWPWARREAVPATLLHYVTLVLDQQSEIFQIFISYASTLPEALCICIKTLSLQNLLP